MKLAIRALGIVAAIGSFGTLASGIAIGQRDAGTLHPLREVLVAEDVTPLATPVWCGSNVVVVSGERTGLRWIDLSTRKATVINRTGVPTACTPDGRWIVYAEPSSSRMVEIDPLSPRWDPATGEMGVRDYWRYNREDGRRERFAVAGGGGQWSPDGAKLLFADGRPRVLVRSGPPRWPLVYSARHWAPGAGLEVVWLADSRHVLVLSGAGFWLESTDGTEPIRRLGGALPDSFSPRVDRLNRIYVLSSGQSPAGRRDLLRCRIEAEAIHCEPLISRTRSISSFDVSPDGKLIAFEEVGVDCLLLWKGGSDGSHCMVAGTEQTGFRLSPDASRLVFGRERRGERKVVGSGPHYRMGRTDLFVVDVPRDDR
jgi:dipeptidyl aminopeptidase/acylaminoacyl peptidase